MIQSQPMSTKTEAYVFCTQDCKKCGAKKDVEDICFNCGVCERCCSCGEYTMPVLDQEIEDICYKLIQIAFPEEAPMLDEADYRLIGDRQGSCDELRAEDVIDAWDPFPDPEMEFCVEDCTDNPFPHHELCVICARCKKHCVCAEDDFFGQ